MASSSLIMKPGEHLTARPIFLVYIRIFTVYKQEPPMRGGGAVFIATPPVQLEFVIFCKCCFAFSKSSDLLDKGGQTVCWILHGGVWQTVYCVVTWCVAFPICFCPAYKLADSPRLSDLSIAELGRLIRTAPRAFSTLVREAPPPKWGHWLCWVLPPALWIRKCEPVTRFHHVGALVYRRILSLTWVKDILYCTVLYMVHVTDNPHSTRTLLWSCGMSIPWKVCQLIHNTSSIF